MYTYDTIVVGAGPAGASCAYHLSQYGLNVLLLDRDCVDEGRYKTCGGGISDKLFWSIPREAIQPAIEDTITQFVLRVKDLPPVKYMLDTPLCYMTMRSNLDRCLLNLATSFGATFRRERVTAVTRNTVTTTAGKYAAYYIVAADGAYSPVARMRGIPRHRRQLVAIEDEAYGESIEDWSGKLEIQQSLNPLGYWWTFPKSDHLSTGFGGPAQHARRMKEWVLTYTDGLLSHARHHTTAHYIPLRDKPYPVTAANLFLVGDAGGFADPCTGEGIAWAALSGKEAARAISATDPSRYRKFAEWVDQEFTAARAFRNLLAVRMSIRGKRLILDKAFWEQFFEVGRGNRYYHMWYDSQPMPVRWLAWVLDKRAPV